MKMKNRFLNFLMVFAILTCAVVEGRAQDQAEAKLQKYTIRIGDQTKLFLSVHQPVKEHVIFPKFTDTITGKVQLLATNKPDTTFDKNNRELATITQSYTITCFDAGTYTIPSFTIGISGGYLKTNELTLQVQTVKVDTTKAIYDIKQPLAVSYSFIDWLKDNWQLLAVSAGGLLLVIVLVYYLTKRQKPEMVEQPVMRSLPAHIIAINKLAELRDKKLWQEGGVKEYYSELTDIVREYLEKRYNVRTHEKTTDEIFAALKYKKIDERNWTNLSQLLILADLVKFAKEKPLPAGNEQSMDDAVNFVLKTKLDTEPMPDAEGGDEDGLA